MVTKHRMNNKNDTSIQHDFDWNLYMSGTADLPEYVPSTETSNNRTGQYLGNTVGGVGFPI